MRPRWQTKTIAKNGKGVTLRVAPRTCLTLRVNEISSYKNYNNRRKGEVFSTEISTFRLKERGDEA